MEATNDNVIMTIRNDRLKRSVDVKAMIDFLNKREGNMFIAIDAEWGAGKSFFVRQIEMTLRYLTNKTWAYDDKRSAEESELVKIEREAFENNQILSSIDISCSWLPIYFNAWLYDDSGDPLLSLMLAILKETKQNAVIKERKSVSDKLIKLMKGVKLQNIVTLKCP